MTYLNQWQGDSMNLARSREDNFSFREIKILPGNIGYIKFHGFSGLENEARPTITAAFRFLPNTQALIIDLRSSGKTLFHRAGLCSCHTFCAFTQSIYAYQLGRHRREARYTHSRS